MARILETEDIIYTCGITLWLPQLTIEAMWEQSNFNLGHYYYIWLIESFKCLNPLENGGPSFLCILNGYQECWSIFDLNYII